MTTNEVITDADKLFIAAIYKGSSPWEAAIKAFPMMDDPVEYALELIDTSSYIQQRLRGYFDKHNLTDKEIVEKFAQVLDRAMGNLTEDNALMDTKAALSTLKEIAKLKDLYPTTQSAQSFKVPENFDPLSQFGMLKMYMENALNQLPEKELTQKVRQPIIDLPALKDKDVFDG